jgi:hypothetical protein
VSGEKYALGFIVNTKMRHTYHLTKVSCDFFGMISSMNGSSLGKASTIFAFTALCTLLLTFCRPAMSSVALNFLNMFRQRWPAEEEAVIEGESQSVLGVSFGDDEKEGELFRV